MKRNSLSEFPLKTAKQYKSIYSRFSAVCHEKTWKNI